jgi:hypothetical protein
MKTNVAACSSIGSYFYPQIGRIYHDMLSMYRATSQMISDAVTREGRVSLPRWFGWKLTQRRSNCHKNAESPRNANDQERNFEVD